MDEATALALVDAELVEASTGTSTLVHRDEWVDSLLDLRTALTDFYVIRRLEADVLRKERRRRL